MGDRARPTVAELQAEVDGRGILSLYRSGLLELPEGIGQLTGVRRLLLFGNPGLRALPAGLWSLGALEDLRLGSCGLRSLPELGVGQLTKLQALNVSHNRGLQSRPAGLCSLGALEGLGLRDCGLRSLPEGRLEITTHAALEVTAE
jgi:hypothetical protein